MKRTFTKVVLSTYEAEFPDRCPKCDHDLTEELDVIQLSYESQSYNTNDEEWGDSRSFGDGYETGIRCSECDYEVHKEDVSFAEEAA